MAEELLPIFIGIFISFISILIAFILGIFGVYTKLIEIIKPLTKIETHASRIPRLEENIGELTRTIERGRMKRSVRVRLEKSEINLVVRIKDRTTNQTKLEIVSETPIIPEAARRAIGRFISSVSGVINVWTMIGSFTIAVALNEADPKKTASYVKVILKLLDEEWHLEKNWEGIFKKGMTE